MKGQVENVRKIFIGGLNYETTRETLLNYFSTFGHVHQMDLPLDDVHVGENKGFVLVTFETPQAEVVLAKEKHEIDGKFLDARYARPNAVHREFHSGNPFVQKSRRVFVGGIRDSHSREFLKNFFNGFGAVIDVEICYNRITGACRGFAFVEFLDASTVDKILQQKQRHFLIGSDKCEVKPAYYRDIGEKNHGWNGSKRRRGGFGKSFLKTSSNHGYGSNASPTPGVLEEQMCYNESLMAPFAFYQNTPPPNVVQFELPPLNLSSSFYPTSPEFTLCPAVPPPTALQSPVIFQEFPEVVNYLPYYASF